MGRKLLWSKAKIARKDIECRKMREKLGNNSKERHRKDRNATLKRKTNTDKKATRGNREKTRGDNTDEKHDKKAQLNDGVGRLRVKEKTKINNRLVSDKVRGDKMERGKEEACLEGGQGRQGQQEQPKLGGENE